MCYLLRIILTGVIFLAGSHGLSPPVVLWHGMGDTCCNEGSLGRIINLLDAELNGTTILSLSFGNTTLEDEERGFFANANHLVQEACDYISSVPALRQGYNSIGFSQGGQFLRAVAQRCPNPPMRTLVSLGGQHQGVFGPPRCAQPETALCESMRQLLNKGAYVGWIQDSLVQAQYWHDPLDLDVYRESSIFLADINNEKDVKNETYVENLQKLQKLVLVLFANDTMVAPRESSWFGFYAPGQDKIVQPMEETAVYTQDLLGLKKMKDDGLIDFLSTEGEHLHFTEEWFIENIVNTYLRN